MCTCRKDINTLKRERIILELIDQIEDPETKIKYLPQISQKEKIITNSINYNLTNVSNRFKKEKCPITVQDLKFEINNIKQELKYNFKISNEQLVQKIITLQTEKQQINERGPCVDSTPLCFGVVSLLCSVSVLIISQN
jgi:hypothetical protein